MCGTCIISASKYFHDILIEKNKFTDVQTSLPEKYLIKKDVYASISIQIDHKSVDLLQLQANNSSIEITFELLAKTFGASSTKEFYKNTLIKGTVNSGISLLYQPDLSDYILQISSRNGSAIVVYVYEEILGNLIMFTTFTSTVFVINNLEFKSNRPIVYIKLSTSTIFDSNFVISYAKLSKYFLGGLQLSNYFSIIKEVKANHITLSNFQIDISWDFYI